MPVASASTSYKKQDGIIAIATDRRSVSWSPLQPPGASPAVTLDVTKITNLQQTPADKPKVMLKIFVTEAGQTEPGSHVFQFTSKTDARGEANAIRDALSSAMAKATAALKQPASVSGQSAAMTIAAAISGSKGAPWEDDDKLIADARLQSALLKANPELQKTYTEAKSMKPESLPLLQFAKQFWTSRIHLLRAQALSQSQSKGSYNVFSEIKATEQSGKQSINLTSEHIKTIFEQFPVMRIVYDEVVPKKINNEIDFWARFFQSQLFQTLRGLKVDRRSAAKDAILDHYLDHPQLTGVRATSSELHIPKFIDLEGNEENHSQRQGNRPDMENRQTALAKGPIIRRLNEMSEKMMISVRPSDVDASAPIGIDEHEYEQLRLRDLAIREEHQRVTLNIRDQSRFYSENKTSVGDAEAARIRALDPTKAIQKICKDLSEHYGDPKTAIAIEIDIEDEDEDMDDEDQLKPRQSGSLLASQHIHSLIEAHRAQYTEADSLGTNPTSYGGLSEATYERLVLTHATTREFLHQFWSAFHSGDASRVSEVSSLVESLNRATDRINAVAADAQSDRDAKLKSLEAQTAEIYRKTGKRKKVDKKAVGGGEAIVRQLLGPCIKSLKVAVDTYTTAYEEQIKEQQQQGDD